MEEAREREEDKSERGRVICSLLSSCGRKLETCFGLMRESWNLEIGGVTRASL